MSTSFEYYKEFYRVQAKLYLSDEGMFKELPEDLIVPYIEVNVVYRIVLADRAGRLRVQDFCNPPAMDKDRNIGGPVTIKGSSKTWFTEPGNGTKGLECEEVYSYILNGDQAWFAAAEESLRLAKQRDGIDG